MLGAHMQSRGRTALPRSSPRRITLESPAFFIASPGDLADERDAIKQWYEVELQERYAIDVYAYEYEPELFTARATYQNQIPYPSDEEAVVTICLLGENWGPRSARILCFRGVSLSG
jgi:hypothetical protein